MLQNLYFLSFFLINLPPIFLFYSLINTHTLAKLILFLLFIFFIIRRVKEWKQNKNEFKQKNVFLALVILYFMSQAVSIVSANNITAFLSKFEDLFFSLIFLFVTIFVAKERKELFQIVVKFLLFTAVFNIIFQSILLFNGNALFFLSKFIHSGYIELISMNLQRGRIYIETYDEILIPIILYSFYFTRNKKNAPLFILLILIIFFSLISGFRTRLIMMILSFMGFYLLLLPKGKKVIISFLFFISFLFLFNNQVIKLSSIDRLIENQNKQIETLSGRVDKWKKAISLAEQSPFFGVGLGNYYDNLNFLEKKSLSIFKQLRIEQELASFYPHNIFFETLSESGYLGLLSLLFMITNFAVNDIKTLFKKGQSIEKKVPVLSFWTLIVYSLLNPANNIKYLILFWFLRYESSISA